MKSAGKTTAALAAAIAAAHAAVVGGDASILKTDEPEADSAPSRSGKIKVKIEDEGHAAKKVKTERTSDAATHVMIDVEEEEIDLAACV